MEWPEINVAVEELTFSLFQRPLHPELFQIYAKRELKNKKYEAYIWVTGCTHVATVHFGDICLSEVVSTPGQVLPQRDMTDFQVEKMSANLYRQSHADLKRFARNRGLFVKFPTLEVDGLPPFCYIDFEAKQGELNIHTFAAYPDQVTMIKTQSLFEFK
jgi:hypothetical protein